MAVIGIDLGTTNSLAAVWQQGRSRLIPNALGDVLTPSAVSIDEDGTVLVGEAARQRLVSHPERSAAAFKRAMGTDQTYSLAGRTFTPEELSALVLRQLKQDAEAFLGEPVEEAVVSVPAYFNDRQRAATKRAGQLAGLRVERLVNEPSAAALSCYKPDEGEASFLVFDFGGGTLDVSVVECFDNVVNILAVSGDNALGGNDFDETIAHLFCVENGLDYRGLDRAAKAILLEQAEKCKQALTENPMAVMIVDSPGVKGALSLTGKKLVEHSQKLLERMRTPVARALRDSGLGRGELAGVIPVGGSCKMPLVRQYLAHLLGQRPKQNAQPVGGTDTAAGKVAAQDIQPVPHRHDAAGTGSIQVAVPPGTEQPDVQILPLLRKQRGGLRQRVIGQHRHATAQRLQALRHLPEQRLNVQTAGARQPEAAVERQIQYLCIGSLPVG